MQPTRITIGPKTRLALALRNRIGLLHQIAEWLKVDAQLAVECGEPETHSDILIAAVKVRDAAQSLEATSAWRDADDDWSLDDRVGLAEDYVDG